MVDAGRTAVLAAEEIAFGGTTLDLPVDRVTADRTIAEITAGPWWRSCGVVVAVQRPRRGTRSSSARHRPDHVEIQLSDEQLTRATVAHELAHALATVARRHDEVFRAAYLDVVAVIGGTVCADALADAFAAMGIAAGDRRWPAPYWAEGDAFRMIGTARLSVCPKVR